MKARLLRNRHARPVSWLDSLAAAGLTRGLWRHPHRQLLAHQDALWVTARAVRDYPDDRYAAAGFMNTVAHASARWLAQPQRPTAISNNTAVGRERAAQWLEAAGGRAVHNPTPAALALAVLVLLQQLFDERHPTEQREFVR